MLTSSSKVCRTQYRKEGQGSTGECGQALLMAVSVAPFTLALWGSNRCIAPWHLFGPLMPQLKSLPLVGHPLEGKKKTLFRSPATVTSRREMTVWFGIDRHNNKILKNQFFSFENIQRFEFPQRTVISFFLSLLSFLYFFLT